MLAGGMHTTKPAETTADHSATPLSELRSAIVAAAANGATYPWIAGVLAGCLADDATPEVVRQAAIDALCSR